MEHKLEEIAPVNNTLAQAEAQATETLTSEQEAHMREIVNTCATYHKRRQIFGIISGVVSLIQLSTSYFILSLCPPEQAKLSILAILAMCAIIAILQIECFRFIIYKMHKNSFRQMQSQAFEPATHGWMCQLANEQAELKGILETTLVPLTPQAAHQLTSHQRQKIVNPSCYLCR